MVFDGVVVEERGIILSLYLFVQFVLFLFCWKCLNCFEFYYLSHVGVNCLYSINARTTGWKVW